MIKTGSFWFLAVLLIILTACSLNSGSGTQRDATPGVDPAILFFPRVKNREYAYPAARLRGDLLIVNGCLNGRYMDRQDDGILLAWPTGYTWKQDGDIIQVFNRYGKQVAETGQPLEVGGGAVSTDFLEPKLEAPLPDACRAEKIWLVMDDTSKP